MTEKNKVSYPQQLKNLQKRYEYETAFIIHHTDYISRNQLIKIVIFVKKKLENKDNRRIRYAPFPLPRTIFSTLLVGNP